VTTVIFVNGFNRSGTTLLTTSITEAAKATTLTVGDLARHMPSVATFLADAEASGITPDRGVDRLPVTPTTPEEYGWFLHAKIDKFGFGPTAAKSGVMESLIDELAVNSGRDTVVLKNPWDTGEEAFLLSHFPEARIVLVRRSLPGIEDSLTRAWERMSDNHGWAVALLANPEIAAGIIGVLEDPEKRKAMVADTIAQMHSEIDRLIGTIKTLPPERVAYICYDEFRQDPRAAAAWAAHIVDPEALAGAVAGLTFPEFNQPAARNEEVRALDERWAGAWDDARAAQIAAGVLARPAQ
jgi:hypothetical protein